MPDIALEMDRVFKKFKKGQLHDSLRDLIPALTGRLLGRRRENELAQREFWAVRDVSFQVERGEAFGVIGNNGAGKSTILKLLTGIMKPTRGTLAVRGRLSALIEVSAGFHPDLTGRENIYLNGTILGMRRQEITRRFDEIVAFSGLEEFIDTPVKRYSSGMYARLGFSVAAHVDPDILIVDEVLSVGDFVFQHKCVERMTSIIRGGATVVFVSHNLRAVGELCHRALLMSHGQVAAIGPTDEVVRGYLEQAETRRSHDMKSGIFVSRVDVRDGTGARAHVTSGERITIDVEVVSRGRFPNVAIVVGLKDAKDYLIFDASSERVLGEALTLEANQAVTCTFELSLHLAPGKYRVCTWVHRSDIQKQLDYWASAATVFVSSPTLMGGVVNLYPTARLGPKRLAPPAGDSEAAAGSVAQPPPPPTSAPPPAPRYPEIGIVALVLDLWTPHFWGTTHQVLTRLSRWFQVLWLDRPLGWRDAWSGQTPVERRRTGTSPVAGLPPGFVVLQPGRWLPEVYRPAVLRRWLDRARLRAATWLLRRRGARHIIYYLWRPEFGWALGVPGACGTIYHVVDEYSFSADDPPVSAAEADLLRSVNRVIVHSPALQEKRGGYNPHTSVIPNGVDFAAFATPQPIPADLAPIPAPRIGYVGFLKKMLDVPLMLELARRHPAWSFVLVGHNHLPPDAAQALGEQANIHLLGGRTRDQVPAYVQHMDVCILPYVQDGYTKYIYPLKLHEYLAAGRPVVATPIRSLLDFRDVIALASTADEWSVALAAAMAPADAETTRRRQQVAQAHDWDALVERIAALAQELATGREGST